MAIGVLALQGDVREHAAALLELGEEAMLVRRPADAAGLDGIVLPGGESTTLSMLLESSGLFDVLGDALAGGLPVFGTCAGLVLLSSVVLDGRPDQRVFGRLDCTVRRNGYGRQLDSFEAELSTIGLTGPEDDPIPAVFIRAPVIVETGPDVEVLATFGRDGEAGATPVACRQGSVLATTFHPELTRDRRLHRLFVSMVEAYRNGDGIEGGTRRLDSGPGATGSVR